MIQVDIHIIISVCLVFLRGGCINLFLLNCYYVNSFTWYHACNRLTTAFLLSLLIMQQAVARGLTIEKNLINQVRIL